MLGVKAQPGVFALMDMPVCITMCVCHWVPVSLGKHCFMHLFVHPLCVDVTHVILCVFGVINQRLLRVPIVCRLSHTPVLMRVSVGPVVCLCHVEHISVGSIVGTALSPCH